MATLDATGEFFAADLSQLTAGLYQHILAAEPLVQSRRRRRREGLGPLLEQARSTSRRYNEACGQLAARWDATCTRAEASWQETCARATSGWQEAKSQWTRTEALLEETAGTLRAWVAELDGLTPREPQLQTLWERLSKNYEALRDYTGRLRTTSEEATSLGAIKPRNYARNLFHVGMGLGGVLAYHFLLSRTQALVVLAILLGSFVLTDVLRRFSRRFNEALVAGIFGKISRPEEAHKVPAATWFCAALLLGVAVLPQPAVELGVLILGLADPAASLIGKRFGRRKLYLQKSFAGTLGFFAVALALALPFFLVLAPTPATVPLRLLAGATVALTGTLAELFSGRIDDNFSISLLAGGVAALWLA
ncbi:MAG: SEC59/DGK1/VTE5 family protein [Myxococcota bacterium]|jgi:dolichol kinase|nr:SEC59/DGK1/VTE5 family protein [Myxococcota bacterium]